MRSVLHFPGRTTLAALLGLALLLPLHANAAEETDATGAADMVKSTAEHAVSVALRIISEKGTVFPFGLTVDDQEKVSSIVWDEEKAQAETPSSAEWTAQLVRTLKARTAEENAIQVASVVRLIEAERKSGGKVPGIWILVQHRKLEPSVLFVPLVKENGSWSLGQTITQPTGTFLFKPGGAN